MSSVRLFNYVELPSMLINEQLKPVDEKERALLETRLNAALNETFKNINAKYKELKSIVPSVCSLTGEPSAVPLTSSEPQNNELHYASLVRNFKTEVLDHSNCSTLDSNILDFMIAANNLAPDKKDEQAMQNVMQKKAELEKALEYAIQQRKLWLVYQAYNEWKYPSTFSMNSCTLL